MPSQLLNHFLEQEGLDRKLTRIFVAISRAGKYVAHAIRTGDLGLAGTSNLYGENQLALDVLADKIFSNHLKETGLIHSLISEEQEKKVSVSSKGEFCVAFDPLDGSSLVETNLSIGAIFGIFPGEDLKGKTGRDLIASCYLVFGPRLVFVLAIRNKVWEFTMNELGEFVCTRKNIKVGHEACMFAPGNLRAVSERKDYAQLVDYWHKEQFTLRYSGGMVPDVHAIFAKGQGIFSYPSYSKYPNGKLRLLFECAPLAFIMEQAGGMAKDEYGTKILDIKIEKEHQRTSIFIGSSTEVERAVEFLWS